MYSSSFPLIAGNFYMFVVKCATVVAWIAVLGNGLVLWALLSSKKNGRNEITNLIICAQAAIDFLSGLLTGCFGIFSSALHHFPGAAYPSKGEHFYEGETLWRGPLCTLYGYFLHLICFNSIFTLSLIAWERYCSVARPLKGRMSKKSLFRYCVSIWACGMVFAAVPAWRGEYVLHEPGAFCYGLIGPNVTATITCIAILSSSGCINFLYSRMYVQVIEAFKGRMKSKENEISKQFLVIIICFMGCWLPAGIDFFLGMIGNKTIKAHTFVHFVRPLSYLLCTGNSAVNPLLYIFMNKKVKKIVYLHVLHLVLPKTQLQALGDARVTETHALAILVQSKRPSCARLSSHISSA